MSWTKPLHLWFHFIITLNRLPFGLLPSRSSSLSCCFVLYGGALVYGLLAFPYCGKTLSSTYCPCFFSPKSISSIVDDRISLVVSKKRLRRNAVKACFGVSLLIQQSGIRLWTLDLDVYHLLFYSIGWGALLHTVPHSNSKYRSSIVWLWCRHSFRYLF